MKRHIVSNNDGYPVVLHVCPDECAMGSWHYCGNGTHCDEHCACSCYMCLPESAEGRAYVSGRKQTQ